MAFKPPKVNTKGASGGLILEKVIEESGIGYPIGAPLETQTTAGFMSAARYILASENRMNAVINALQNRFFVVIMMTMAFYDEWSQFTEKGILEDGEGIEEIYIGLCDPEQYEWTTDINKTMKALFGKRKQEVATAFHAINYQKRYTITISYDELRKALRSPGQLQRFVDEKSKGSIKSYLYDNRIMNKYMLYRLALDGKFYNINVAPLTRDTASDAVIKIQAFIEDALNLRSSYTISKLPQSMEKDKAVVARTAIFAAYINVDVLAQAYNMTRAEYARRQINIDGFNEEDIKRLSLIEADDPDYVPFTDDELAIINNNMLAFIFDEDFFQNYTYLFEPNDWSYNGAERYTNYFLHVWKVYGVSPFKTIAVVTSAVGSINSVSVLPTAIELPAGATYKVTATVTKTGIIDNAVTWTTTADPDTAVVLPDGTIEINKTAAAGVITVTATSVADPTKSASATVTITA